MQKVINITALVLALSLLAPASALGQARLYRYTTDDGVVVVGYQVPNEYVGRGYEVLNSQGRLIEVVPPQLSEEEQRAEQAARAEKQRLKEWDESLLLRYSTVADIEAARERSLDELRINLEILKSNQRNYQQQVETYQAQAADQERAGRSPDEKLLKAIEDLQGQIENTDRAITEREAEIEAVYSAYQRDIERFELLEQKVELRQRRSTEGG